MIKSNLKILICFVIMFSVFGCASSKTGQQNLSSRLSSKEDKKELKNKNTRKTYRAYKSRVKEKKLNGGLYGFPTR